MLQALKQWMAEGVQETEAPGWEMAVAVLLMEVARADFHISQTEQKLIASMIASEYQLEAAMVDELMATARIQVDEEISLHPFLRQINDQFSQDQRQRLVEMMWRVALIDNGKHRFEEALIRRVSDLLYVEHSRFIRAKLDATDWIATGA